MNRQPQAEDSKLVVYATTAIWLAGFALILYVATKADNEIVSLFAILLGNLYFLAYSRIERFVWKLSREVA